MRRDLVQHGAVGKGGPAGQQGEQRAAEAVDVGPDIGGVGVFGLLGGDVIGRPHHGAHLRELVQGGGRLDAALVGGRPDFFGRNFGGKASQTEIQDLDFTRAGVTHQVVRLDVAMDHAQLVGVLQPVGRLADVFARLDDWQRPAPADDFVQVHARHEFHHQKVQIAGLLGIVGGDDMAMVQAGSGLHFAAEPLDRRLVAPSCALITLSATSRFITLCWAL